MSYSGEYTHYATDGTIVTVDVRETGKAYTIRLRDCNRKYLPPPLDDCLKPGVARAIKGRSTYRAAKHALRVIEPDRSFTLYPFRVGVPFYFEKV